MSKRHYLADIMGSGTEQDMFRVAIEGLAQSHAAFVPCDKSTGAPLKAWALVEVVAAEHTDLLANDRIDALLDRPLEYLIADITSEEQVALRNALARREVPTSALDNAITYADVLFGIGSAVDPSFTMSKIVSPL